MLCLLGMISVITSCSNDDDLSQEIPISELVTPKVTYYGNYVDGKLTPFNGYYRIFEGHTYGEYNRVLNLPKGQYNIVYWGTPKYEEPIYSTPAIVEPGVTLGADVSQLYFALRPNNDGTYMPVFDMVHDFQASLKRVVAGLKVIVKKEDNGLFGSEIAKMQIFIHDIAEKINFYTAEPENMSKTVKFDLVASADGTSMSNATVMLFPSAATPQLELMITTRDGQTQTLSKNLTSTLSANTRLTLNIIIKDPNPGGSVTGNFSIENWKEASETIEFTMEN